MSVVLRATSVRDHITLMIWHFSGPGAVEGSLAASGLDSSSSRATGAAATAGICAMGQRTPALFPGCR